MLKFKLNNGSKSDFAISYLLKYISEKQLKKSKIKPSESGRQNYVNKPSTSGQQNDGNKTQVKLIFKKTDSSGLNYKLQKKKSK
jgi:hypothetical protein